MQELEYYKTLMIKMILPPQYVVLMILALLLIYNVIYTISIMTGTTKTKNLIILEEC